jgi:hypothetical protein
MLLLAWSAAAAGQDPLGTLFHTPKERDLLERLRRGEKVEAAAVTRPDPTITGFVKRSDGKSTVFLDKQPFAVGNQQDNNLIEPGVVQRFDPAPPPPPPVQGPQATPAKRENAEPEGKGLIPRLRDAAKSSRRKADEGD